MSWAVLVMLGEVAKAHVDVVCGIISNDADEYLVALRQAHQEQGGLWEFPGGKIQAGEIPFDALCRELKEEIDIQVIRANALLQIDHEYPKRHVSLHVWQINEYRGEPVGAEGQYIQWVPLHRLKHLAIPAANQAVIELLSGVE